MKKVFALALSVLSISAVSSAYDQVQYNNPYLPQNVQNCAAHIHSEMNTIMWLAEQACSYGRTDVQFRHCTLNIAKARGETQLAFAGFLCANGVDSLDYRLQDCTLELTSHFGTQFMDYSLAFCRRSQSPTFSSCVIDLYKNGGVSVEDNNLVADGYHLCQSGTNQGLNQCIIAKHQREGVSGGVAVESCLQTYDPGYRNHQLAEKNRLEQQRLEQQRKEKARAAEAKKLAEKKKQEVVVKEKPQAKPQAPKQQVEVKKNEKPKEQSKQPVKQPKQKPQQPKQQEQPQQQEQNSQDIGNLNDLPDPTL